MSISIRLNLFQSTNDVLIPPDLANYFMQPDNIIAEYNRDMFTFYGLDQFKSVKDEVGDYAGSPDYTRIVDTLPSHQNCYVFAEYFTYTHVYAIRLGKTLADPNEVYVICGDEFKCICNSFGDFLELYKADDAIIYI